MSQEKKDLRRHLQRVRQQVGQEQRKKIDPVMRASFFAMPEYQMATWLMAYWPMADEFDVRPIIQQAWDDGKQVALPRIIPGEKMLEVVALPHAEALVAGVWGILEPLGDAVVSPNALDLIIVPGLGFSRGGARIGYGGGYYDRFLPRTRGLTVSFCYQDQLCQPPQAIWDVIVDRVICEDTVYNVST